jgi:hypothetical protein
MRQAIETKYLGPTDHRGARVKATAQAGSITVPWDHALDVGPNHFRAAYKLARKFGWVLDEYCLVGGGNADGSGYCFVEADKTDPEDRFECRS